VIAPAFNRPYAAGGNCYHHCGFIGQNRGEGVVFDNELGYRAEAAEIHGHEKHDVFGLSNHLLNHLPILFVTVLAYKQPS